MPSVHGYPREKALRQKEGEYLMWILTSLMRPDRINKVVESYDWTNTKVSLTLYERDPRLKEYLANRWPETWTIELVPMLGNGPSYNEILRRYPNEKFFGYLADDSILEVQGMLRMLEVEAGDWNVAYANDKHHGSAIPTMPCMGGELVRAVGYLAPDSLVHWALDNVWYEIGRRIDGLRYRADLTYEHLNPIWGTAPDDKTYRLARQNSVGYQDHFRAWMFGGELNAAVDRVKQAQQQRRAA